MKNYYYLTVEEMYHYRYMLSKGYASKVINLGTQSYLVFALSSNPDIGIAWPTVSGDFDSLPTDADVVFQPYSQLQAKLLPHIIGSTIRLLLFPRYAN